MAAAHAPRGVHRARQKAIGRRLIDALDREAWTWLGLALLVVSLGGFAASLAPLALKTLIDHLTSESRAGVSSLARLIGFYVGALLIQRLCEQVQAFAYSRGEQRLVRRFARQTFAHLLTLPLGFHLDNKSGGLAQALSEGILGIRLILTHLALTIAPVAVQLIVAGVVLGSVFGLEIGSILIIALVAYCAVFTWGVFRLHGSVRGISAAQVDVGGATADGLMNIEAIKAYTAERRFARRYDELLGQTEGQWRIFLRRRLENGLAVAVVFGFAVGAIHLSASGQVARGALTLGGFVLINTYVLQLVRPLEMLGFAIRDIGQGLAYLDRIGGILSQETEAIDALSDTPVAEASFTEPAELVFENVSFAYGDRQTLSDISFRAAPGQQIGIVGSTGGGKSSMLKLVLRFWEPTSGRILLDGQPISDMPLAALRGQIALVSQDTILLNDTIAANIGLADDQADEAAIHAAASRARLSELLGRLTDGLHTLVGERGLKLSGGEKQRVSIARAALKQARLVIFDEATAALDPATERAVWEAMEGLAQSATTLIVTHRLSTVAGVDEILVIDQGRIVERGRHTALLAAGGHYAALWRAQTSGVVRAAQFDDHASLASSL